METYTAQKKVSITAAFHAVSAMSNYQVFTEDDDGYAYVTKTPSDEELEVVKELILDCPAGSIVLKDH